MPDSPPSHVVHEVDPGNAFPKEAEQLDADPESKSHSVTPPESTELDFPLTGETAWGACPPSGRTRTGIWFSEQEPYTEALSHDLQEARRTLACRWEDRKQFEIDMVGHSYLDGSALRRHLPHQHPDLPHLWCSNIELRQGQGSPTQADTGLIRYEDRNTRPDSVSGGRSGLAVFEVTYTSRPYAVLEDGDVSHEGSRYISVQIGFSSEVLPFKGELWKLAAFGVNDNPISPIISNTVPENGVVIPFFKLEFIVTWHELPRVPQHLFSPSATLVGKLNHAAQVIAVDGGSVLTAPKETLLCKTPDVEQYRQVDGSFGYDVHYRIEYRPNTHNRFFFWFPNGNSGFYLITDDGTVDGRRVFELADFNNLFVI